MHWSPAAVAEATGGRLTARGDLQADVESLAGVSIDSRRLARGELFVAIRAERDGHDFVAAAVAAGAGALLVDRGDLSADVPLITVDDTGRALLAIGRAARDRLPGPVAAITGSVGKTSTKDMAAAALASRLRAVASERSFNNELGVPLTLANAADDTEVAVVEMGARGIGHIALLCRTARPTIGVVTAVSAAHTETFGGLEAIAEAKGELVESLAEEGTAVLNRDDELVRAMSTRTRAAILSYSASGQAADVAAENVTLDSELRPHFTVRTPWGTAQVRLEARGVHQVGNALAALAVAATCGVDLEPAVAALAESPLSPWRMEVQRTSGGAVLINDAYNANPASMEAALRALAAVPAQRRIAVLGTMAELGPRGASDHLAAAALAERLGIEVLAVGSDAYGVEPRSVEEAAAVLRSLAPGDAVLVKASRVAGLEVLAQEIKRG
jgi:UDP-N-acetylmuramoyl-tripeptide--D-alanyl-D-alanine ligase